MTSPFDLARDAADTLRGTLGARPSVGVVAGSGWAGVSDGLGDVVAEMPLDRIPGIPAPTVVGHSGVARLLDVGGIPALMLAGRSHLYEGHSVDTVVHAVRAAVFAGCHTVVLTNAAGSLDSDRSIGEAVIIADQLNLTGANPMCGAEPGADLPPRFADLTNLYASEIRAAVRAEDPTLAEGVYAGMLGGSYETPAEIAMLATLGADLVGMSTVLEAIAARHLGARVAGISLVTNHAAGMGPELSHGEVLAAGSNSVERMIDVCRVVVEVASTTADGEREGIS